MGGLLRGKSHVGGKAALADPGGREPQSGEDDEDQGSCGEPKPVPSQKVGKGNLGGVLSRAHTAQANALGRSCPERRSPAGASTWVVLSSATGSPGGAHQVLQVAPWAALRLFVELPGAPLSLLQRRVAGDHHLPEERHRYDLEIFPIHRSRHPSPPYLDPLSLCLLRSTLTMLSGRGSDCARVA